MMSAGCAGGAEEGDDSSPVTPRFGAARLKAKRLVGV